MWRSLVEGGLPPVPYELDASLGVTDLCTGAATLNRPLGSGMLLTVAAPFGGDPRTGTATLNRPLVIGMSQAIAGGLRAAPTDRVRLGV